MLMLRSRLTASVASPSPQLIGQGEGRLLVLTAAPCHSAEYLCEAKNRIGSQRSRPLPLEVGPAPGQEPAGPLLQVSWV